MTLDIDTLAQEIRRVRTAPDMGSGSLAEALMPFLAAWLSPLPVSGEKLRERRKDERAEDMFHFLNDKKMVAEFNRWRSSLASHSQG